MNREQLDIQVENAIHLIDENDYDTISPSFLQRSLGLEFSEGLQLFKELVGIGIVHKYWLDEDQDDDENFIGEIDKSFLKISIYN